MGLQRMILQTRTFARLVCLLPLLAAMVGCGGVASVSGSVTFKPTGKKVTSGNVMVLGSDGSPAYATIQSDGTYRVSGVPSGPVRITVSSPKPLETTPTKGVAPLTPKDRPIGKKDVGPTRPTEAPVSSDSAKTWFAIPEKYSDPNGSGLTATLKGGANTVDLLLD